MTVHICDNCVFCGRLPERNQRACGCYNDDIARVRACVLAAVHEECAEKLTRGDVQDMRQRLDALEARRERDSIALLELENHIVEASELLAELRAEVTVRREDLV